MLERAAQVADACIKHLKHIAAASNDTVQAQAVSRNSVSLRTCYSASGFGCNFLLPNTVVSPFATSVLFFLWCES